jgi:iron(III) transport system ATP-binding protein
MSFLQLSTLSCALEQTPILHTVDLTLAEGEIGCLLGPSGCGKTTLLRLIAGFYMPFTGTIKLRKKIISEPHKVLTPEHRGMGMVFQDYALFPHLSVSDNLRFGLHQWSAADRQARLDEMLQLTGLTHLAHRYPHELSGGQQQRVALGRALAPQPTLLLLDEPFSNLDAKLRRELSQEVRSIVKSQGITALMVTHDQQEAFTMADKAGVMKQGRLLQWDSVENLYHEPNCPEVATFIGEGQLIQGLYDEAGCATTALGAIQVQSTAPLQRGEPLYILLRPKDFWIGEHGSEGVLLSNQFIGFGSELTVELHSNEQIRCQTQDICLLRPQQSIHLRIKPGYYRAFTQQQVCD